MPPPAILYWAEWDTGKIRRARLDGTGEVETLVTTGLTSLSDLVLDVAADYLYWTDASSGKIQRARRDGTGKEDLIPGLSSPLGLALDRAAGQLYWTAYPGKIQRARRVGTDIQDFKPSLGRPARLALDKAAGQLYWTETLTNKLQHARLDGTGDNETLPVTTGLSSLSGVALLLKPGAPGHLSATPGTGKVTLVWTPPVAGGTVAGWEYAQDNGNWTVIAGSSAGTTSHVVTGLTNGTAYTFKVRAVNLVDSGPASAAASATPAAQSAAPGAPTGLTATAHPDLGQVTLTWTAPIGQPITQYQSCQKTGSTATCTDADWAVIPLASRYRVTGLSPGTYTFRVRAKNGAGSGPASNEATVTLLAVPGKPTALKGKAGDRQVKLSWTAPTSGGAVTGYEYRYKVSGARADGRWTVVEGSGATTQVVKKLSNGTTYVFEVRAVNAAGGSPPSNSVTVTPVPAAPADLTGEPGDGQVTLRWTDPGDASISKYWYCQRTDTAPCVAWKEMEGSNAKTTSYTVKRLTNGTTYTFWVRAEAIQDSGPASKVKVRVGPLAKPTGLVGEQTGPGQVTLRWTALADANIISKYQFCQKPGTADCTAADTWTDIAGSGAKTTTHTVPRLSLGDHTFAVRAVNAAGTGPASESVHVTVEPPPPAPTGLRAAPGVGRVALSWTAPTGPVTGYKYCQKTGTATCDAATASDWTPTGSATPAHLVKDLSNGTKYTFQVRVVNTAGDGPASNAASATPTTLQLYWSDAGKIQRAKLAGTLTDIRNSVGDVVNSGLTTPMGLAVDAAAGWLYWADRGTNKLQRANLDGTGVQDLVSTGPSWPTSLALDVAADKLYWTEQATGKIRQAALDGSTSTIRDWVTSGLERPYGLAPDLVAGHLYWTDWGRDKVQRANLAGSTSTIRDLVTRGLRRPYGLALNGGAGLLYWVDWEANKIQRAKRDGSNGRDLVTTGVNSPKGIALDVAGNKLYWSNAYAIWRANLDGTGPEALVTGLSNPQGVALLIPPGTPTGLSATPGHRQVTLVWTRPADGGTIARWEYSSDNGTTWQVPTGVTGTAGTRTAVVPGLTNGTTYTFKVRAVNLAGDGPASTPGVAATPRKPPGAPTGLTATAGNEKVTLSWTAPTTGGTGYEYRYKESAGNYGEWTDTDSTDTTHTVRKLTNGTKYTFQVRAKNGDVPGPPSNEDTETLPPDPPTDLTATPGNAQVTLNWTAPTNGTVTKYEYCQKETNTATCAAGDWNPTGRTTTTPPDTTHPVTGLTNDTTYYFWVRAKSGDVAGKASNKATATPREPPGPPTNLTLTPGNESGQVLLTWTAPTTGGTVTGYDFRYKVGNGNYNTWTPTGGTDTTHLVPEWTNGTTYTFQVRAKNGEVPGLPSNEATDTLGAPPGAPPALTATPDNAQVTLNWMAPTTGPVTGYQYRQKASGSAAYDAWESAGTGTTHPVTGLTNGTTYTFQVRAVNRVVPGPASTGVPVTPRTPPGPPTDLTATPGNERVTLSWTAPANATSYQYCQKATATATCAAGDWKPDNGITTTTHVVSGLENGETYTFRVRAKNGEVPGLPSEPKTVTLPPGKPTGLTGTPGDGQVTLSWTAPDGVKTGYAYRYKEGDKESEETYTTWTDTNSTDTTHTVPGLTNSTTYTFEVRAKSGEVAGKASEPKTVTLPPGKPTGLTPTPGNKHVTLRWADPDDASITKYQYCQKTGTATCDADTASDWTDMEGSGAKITTHTVKKLTNDTIYTFEVRAVNAGGSGLAASVSATPVALQQLYWSDDYRDRIYRANLDGTDAEIPVTGLGQPWGLALDGAAGKLYWTTSSTSGTSTTGKIQRANLDGTGVEDLVPGLGRLSGLALDGAADKLYWSTFSTSGTSTTGKIQWAKSDGTGGVKDLVPGLVFPSGLALDVAAGKLYWIDYNAHKLQRANLDGTGVEDLVPVFYPTGLALDVAAKKLYWTSSHTHKIYQANLDGTDVKDLVPGQPPYSAWGLALNVADGQVYWRNGSKLWRASLDGGTGVQDIRTISSESRGLALLLKPGAPTDLNVTPGTGQVTLAWTPPVAGGTVARWEYSKDNGTNWAAIAGSTARTTTHVVKGLTNSTAYIFKVRAGNLVGDGPASSAVSATPLVASAAPGAPTGLTAIAGNGQVTLTWTAPTGKPITKYQYCQKTDTTSTCTDTDTDTDWTDISRLAPTHTVTGLSNGTTYTFRVRAVNDSGNGPPTDPAATATPQTPPAKPTGLTATAGNTQVTLEWAKPANSNISEYQYRQKAGSGKYGKWMKIPSSGATTKTYKVTGLTNGTTYTFRLRAVTTGGSGLASAEVLATPLPPLRAVAGNGRVVLAWTAPSGTVTGYQYCQKTGTATCDPDTAGDWTDIGSTSTTHLVTKLTNGTEYTFKVRAVTSGGPGSAFTAESATPTAVRQLYWVEGGKIRGANLDGTGVKDLVTGLGEGPGVWGPPVRALDGAAGKLYWINEEGRGTFKIQRANLDGTGRQDLVTGLYWPELALDVAAGKMYWTNDIIDDPGKTGKIQRANLDGTGVEDFVTDLDFDDRADLALDGAAGKLYWIRAYQSWEQRTTGEDYHWVRRNKIQRADLDDSSVEDLVQTPRSSIFALDGAAGKLYLASISSISRTNLDGTGFENLVTGLSRPSLYYSLYDPTLDGAADKLYWTSAYRSWEQRTTGEGYQWVRRYKIQRANLDGSSVEDIDTGSGYQHSLTLDGAGKLYWAEGSKIRRDNLDGTDVKDLVTELSYPRGLALLLKPGTPKGLSATPRGCYVLCRSRGTSRLSIRIAKVRKWRPAKVVGKRS